MRFQPPASNPPKTRWPAAVRWTIGIVLVLGLCGWGARWWILRDEEEGRKAWEAYRAEAAQRGTKIDLKDFLRPAIPAAQNFAASPLFQLAPGSDELANPFELPERDPKANRDKKDAASELELVRADFARKGWIAKTDQRTTAEVLWTAMARYETAWIQLRQAAAKPDAQFDVSWEKGSLAPPMPHLTLLLRAARVAKIRGQIQLVMNHPLEALQEWRLIWRLSRTVQREPTMINGLVRITLQEEAINLLEQGLELRVWTRPELEEIERALGSVDALAEVAWSYDSERASLNQELQQQFTGRHRYMIRRVGEAEGKADFIDRHLGIYHTLVRLNRDADHALSELDVAQHRYLSKGKAWAPERAAIGLIDTRRYWLYRLISGGVPDLMPKLLYSAVHVDQARVAGALERHRLARGAHPDTLAGLVPEFLKAIPTDLWDGKPLRYKRLEGGRFLLYSVGKNLTDELGATKAALAETPDWVWGQAYK